MNRWSALAILLVFAGALAFRLPRLDTRPLHNDEAVNAVKVAELWQHARYRYDPDEYHGPTLHYATLPFLWLSGAHTPSDLPDRVLRLAPVLFGAALILLLFLFTDALGRQAVVWAALFTAISPAMVFYSRYFIHEMLLVFFTALAIGGGWRYTQSRSPKWAIVAGSAVGFMFATKETFVITLAAMSFGVVATAWWMLPQPRSIKQLLAFARSNQSPPISEAPESSATPFVLPTGRHIALALTAAFIVWLLFFSSFFTNFAGLPDSVRTYFPWLKRAAGHSPHLHPWYFYLQRLGWFHPVKGPVWSEGMILLLALVGAVVSFRGKRSPLLFFLVFYTLALIAAYSVITYKTPWCLLSFYHGMILLAGVGATALVQSMRGRLGKIVAITALLVATAQLTLQAWRASYVYSTDRRNPYVYAQTLPDILKLVQRVEAIAHTSPSGFQTIVKVIAPESDYWPLPWSLRRFKNIGWYDNIPDDPFAPIIIVSSKLDARLDEKSDRKWIMTGLSELRPGKFFELYVELDLWKKFVETLPPDPD